jgi:hypothetical protein
MSKIERHAKILEDLLHIGHYVSDIQERWLDFPLPFSDEFSYWDYTNLLYAICEYAPVPVLKNELRELEGE